MRRKLIVSLAVIALTAPPAAGSTGADGHVFVGGYMALTTSLPGGVVAIRAYERRIELDSGTVAPRTCVAFVEYACGPLDFTVAPTLHRASLRGVLPTESGGRIEVDLLALSGLEIIDTPLGLADRIGPHAGTCNAVFPACSGSLVGGGANVFTTVIPIGTLRYFDAAGTMVREFSPHRCEECFNWATVGWGAGLAAALGEESDAVGAGRALSSPRRPADHHV